MICLTSTRDEVYSPCSPAADARTNAFPKPQIPATVDFGVKNARFRCQYCLRILGGGSRAHFAFHTTWDPSPPSDPRNCYSIVWNVMRRFKRTRFKRNSISLRQKLSGFTQSRPKRNGQQFVLSFRCLFVFFAR